MTPEKMGSIDILRTKKSKFSSYTDDKKSSIQDKLIKKMDFLDEKGPKNDSLIIEELDDEYEVTSPEDAPLRKHFTSAGYEQFKELENQEKQENEEKENSEDPAKIQAKF